MSLKYVFRGVLGIHGIFNGRVILPPAHPILYVGGRDSARILKCQTCEKNRKEIDASNF